MLSVPTLWTVFVINFLALGLIWAYVAHSYPKLEAARFWTASAFAAAFGASAAVVSREFGWILPLLCGGVMILFAICLAAMGVQRFYDRPVSWRGAMVLIATTLAAMAVFTFVHEDVRMRMLIYSLAQAAPFLYVLRLLFSSKDGRARPGARLAGIVAVLILVMFAVRRSSALSRNSSDTSSVLSRTSAAKSRSRSRVRRPDSGANRRARLAPRAPPRMNPRATAAPE